MTVTGKTLIEWGFKPGKWFPKAIEEANRLIGLGVDFNVVFGAIQAMQPVETLMRTNALPFGTFIEPSNDLERDNVAAVVAHMDVLMRVPTIKAGAIMPDACPSGSQPGTIPVGGVVACEDAIHPGFHSSDICCSMAISIFKRKDDPKRLLDAIHAVTHFGPGFRKNKRGLCGYATSHFSRNRFLKGLEDHAAGHMMSQGDGNHFAYVGRLASTGQLALVTHHGSRGLGAQVYKRGKAAAQKHTAMVAPRVPPHNAWLKASSEDGEEYWAALQEVRSWTKVNHMLLHWLAAEECDNSIIDFFWNEHNFVFKRNDGLFYHGKGATPAFSDFAKDSPGKVLIPLNCAAPILIAKGLDKKEALGFAPHGAGRNLGRKEYLRRNDDAANELDRLLAKGLDIRSYCGTPDLSELPSAYKDADSVVEQIERFGLAEVIDRIEPYGSIMAGDWEADAPWRKK